MIGCFQDRGKYYLATPLAKYGSLSILYSKETYLSPKRKIKILLDVAKGIKYLHRFGKILFFFLYNFNQIERCCT